MSNCEKCLTTSYDILGQIISILDVTTDVIVCVGFYQKGRMAFFGISLTIICLALIAYDVAFVGRFSREKYGGDIALFICLLPVTPLMPFIFYFADTRESPLSKLIENYCCGFNIQMENPYIPDDASKLRKFMEEKIEKHFGFIIEALVEAFPQAILQMIAIVVYHEANVIAIISILLSMLSMASKSFIFSVALASNMKQLVFNWLCAITDFFGIFMAVSWVWYEPTHADADYISDAFVMFKTIWFYKLYICVFPMIGIISVGIHCAAMYEAIEELSTKINNICIIICGSICSFLLVTFLWVCGIIASVLVFEILGWTFLAGTLWALGTDRFTYNKNSLQFWYTLVGWINSAKQHRVGNRYKGCISFTKKQDQMMRLCCVNKILTNHKPFPKDNQLQKYLSDNKVKNQYMEVTMNGIRNNTKKRKNSEFLKKFWHSFYGIAFEEMSYNFRHANYRKDRIRWGFILFGTGLISFFVGPIYLLSRFINLFFPIFIVLYLYFGYNVNIWNTQYVDQFQVVMITV
eukprot:108227_1